MFQATQANTSATKGSVPLRASLQTTARALRQRRDHRGLVNDDNII